MSQNDNSKAPDEWEDVRVPVSLSGSAVVVPFVRLRPEARAPGYQTPGAAGMDLFAALPVVIKPGEWELIPTGVSVAIPEGHVGYVCPRSGLALRDGLTVLNGPGVVDSDYTGEVGVVLINHSRIEQRVWAGDRVAQLVIAPVHRARLVEVSDLSETTRGARGFGSTGR